MLTGSPPRSGVLFPQPATRSGRRGTLRLVRLLLVLILLACAFAWLQALRQEVEAGGFAVIATDRARLDTGPGWFDPRWHEELRCALAELEDVRADDHHELERVRERVARLPFVAEVRDLRVLWPDGLRLEVSLREPVACVHQGRSFLVLAPDGTLLPGLWPTPPARDSGFLPVIELPPPEEQATGEPILPGVVLDQPAAADGLSVACSLWREFGPTDLARLGRCVIDARASRATSVEEPGTRLRLEGRRTVWFGRSPNLAAPGELPVATKWAHVARALALLAPDPARSEYAEGLDWDLLDARWDQADLHPRDAGKDPRPRERGR